MKYAIDRLLKFKTVPERWEIHNICDTLEEAESRCKMWNKMVDGGKAIGGGEIIAYRVRELKEKLSA
jgi:hypothetical protein